MHLIIIGTFCNNLQEVFFLHYLLETIATKVFFFTVIFISHNASVQSLKVTPETNLESMAVMTET